MESTPNNSNGVDLFIKVKPKGEKVSSDII